MTADDKPPPSPAADDRPGSSASEDAEKLHVRAVALVARGELETAFGLHAEAARAGHARSCMEAARMQLYGVGAPLDTAAAIRGLEAAEGAGEIAASYLLALVSVGAANADAGGDVRLAARIQACVDAGHPPALLAAALLAGRSPEGAAQAACLRYLRFAAERGHAVAAQLLSERMRDAGHAVPGPILPRCSAPVAPGTPHEGLDAAIAALHAPPQRRALCAQPAVSTIDALLSRDECRFLMASAQPRLRHSRTVDPTSGEALRSGIRTSRDATFDPLEEDLALRIVQARMAAAAGLGLAHAEQLIVLCYSPGEEYRPHRDYLPPAAIAAHRPAAGNRERTLCAYLNDVEAGGETDFIVPGIRVHPRAGTAVAFRNLHEDGRPDADSLHAGRPVERGEKWLATLWMRQAPCRDF